MTVLFEEAIKKYYEMKSKKLLEKLEKRGWTTFFANDREEARNKVLEIIPNTNYKTIGIPGSVTIRQLALIEELEKKRLQSDSALVTN